MSVNTSSHHKGTRTPAVEQFVPVSSRRIMTEERLAECRHPDRNLFEAADADERVVFAVAARHGALQNHREQYELEAHCVMYVTADGEEVLDMFVPGADGDLSDVPRATLAPKAKLSPTEGFAARVAPVVNRHPEV